MHRMATIVMPGLHTADHVTRENRSYPAVFFQDGRREEAFRLLSEMKQERVSADEKTFRLAIQACG